MEADVEALPFSTGSFDTVIDTFGLCSCENPAKALAEMTRVLRPGGLLLLLEHGRGSFEAMNKQLDNNADHHHSKWGCWYNRDLFSLMSDLSSETYQILGEIYRWHFGTTLYYVGRKKNS
jgi:methyltransferase OMS1, mitochondrial